MFMERKVGGRLYERTARGVEHEWGEIAIWDPPRHFAYHWYLGSDSEQPTRVDVYFRAEGEGHTRVDVTHRGPEFIGPRWTRNSALFDAAWETVLPAYSSTCLRHQ